MRAKFILTQVPETYCPECKAYPFQINLKNLRKYFYSEPIICGKCGAKIDWWSTLLRHLDWQFPDDVFGLIGALVTRFNVEMKRNESIAIDFESFGIPTNSKILSIGYSPNGGLIPLEVHGNAPRRHFNPHKIALFGMPFGDPTDSTEVIVSANWIIDSFADNAWQNLIQAFEAYAIFKYSVAIIPANVAVESTLYNIMQTFLVRYSSKKRIEDFLDSRATYSHQLNILLPLVANTFSFPKLPDNIRGNLNRLRNLRNDLAHKGASEIPIAKADCANLLTAAVFGLGYLSILEKHMESSIKIP